MNYLGVLVLLIIAAFTIAAAKEEKSHNVTWGSIHPQDALLYHQIVRKNSKFFQVVSEDVVYPPKEIPANRIITGIRVVDQYQDGKGGYASLYNGGVGFYTVTIHFKSQRNHGYNFILEIYGR